MVSQTRTVPYRTDLIEPIKARASFGIWDLLNKGSDPFGAPVRETFSSEDAINLLGKLQVPFISLHDIDVGLDPWLLPDAAAFDARVKSLQQTLKAAGVRVWMYTPCLFHNPMVRAGSVTSNDARVRRMSLQKIFTSLDVAEEFGASWVTFWLGRDGAEIDALIDGKIAYQRIAEAVQMAAQYITERKMKVRLSLEPKPNEPRGDIYVSTVGTALGIISMLPREYQGLVGINPELLQHEGMAGLNSYHALGQLVASGKLAFLHLGGQTPLRYDQDHPYLGGNSCLKQSFYIALAVAKHAPNCTLEFDCHPFRTEAEDGAREEFVMANLEGMGVMMDKAKRFLALPEVQEVLADTEGLGYGVSADASKDFNAFVQQVRAPMSSAEAIATELRPRAQYLDRLVNLHLLGAL